MDIEFKENDVVVEIMDVNHVRYVVSDVCPVSRGYHMDTVIDGTRRNTFWKYRGFEEVHSDFVKVGTWDGDKEVEDEM